MPLLFLMAALASQASGQRDAPDPAFEKIPFDRWLGERDQARFHWSVSVSHAALSFHQRLIAIVETTVDGRDLESRRGTGELVIFAQVTGPDGTRYQDHNSVDLSKLDENIKRANLQSSQRAFFLPGEYRLAAAILDTATGEHSTKELQFHVVSPKHDVVLDAWRDLPAVEFLIDNESPDSWYLPAVHGRLEWAASVHSAAQLNVILNVAPAARRSELSSTTSSGLAALLPTLKALSQTGSSSLSEHIELLDLARRRIAFREDDSKDLDWPRLKASLGDANTASIDLHSLSERHHEAQFFLAGVRALLRGSHRPCVLAVLTTSIAFDSGEDLQPISLEDLPLCRVIYIRYHASAQLLRPFGEQMRGRSRGERAGGSLAIDRLPLDIVDQLEATLKPLSPKVFDVETPEQMAKALAEIEKALVPSR